MLMTEHAPQIPAVAVHILWGGIGRGRYKRGGMRPRFAVPALMLRGLRVLTLGVATSLAAGATGLNEGYAQGVAKPLATAVIESRATDAGIVVDGVVEAVRQATIAAQIPGRILELRVEAGVTVREGQVLARIDEREVAQVVAASEAQVVRAEADLSSARVNLQRAQRLAEQMFVSPAAVDKARADYDASAAQLAAMKAGAGQSGVAKSYATVTAPFSGVIAVRHAQRGDTVQPGMALFTLYEPGRMRVVANVPEAQLRDARSARTGTIELPLLEKTTAPVAMAVQPVTDPRTHTGTVWLDLPASLAGVSPGSFARVRFAGGRSAGVKKLLVPAQAVVYRSEVAGVYVVDDKGGVRFRQLRLGEAAGTADSEVLAGLQAGERVALDPVAALAQLKRRDN